MGEPLSERECLIVILQEELTIAEGIRWPFEAFRLGDTAYQDVGLGEWTGFYDWMRRDNRDLIGVRYSPLAENAALFEAARGLRYTKADTARALEIYFEVNQVANDHYSCDQEFQYDAIFKSEDNSWAIAFDAIALTAEDRYRLRSIVPRWANVTALSRQGSSDR